MPIDEKDVNKENRAIQKNKMAILRTDRTWLFLLVIIMLVLSVYNTVQSRKAVEDSKNSREVVWVKMWEDGKSEISDFKPDDEQPIIASTINSGLTNYIISRYQIHPETIATDYAEAGVFLGDSLYAEFTDQNGFNAAQKASQISADPSNQARVNVDNIKIDHYDKINGDFSGKEKPIMRTTLSWDEKTVGATSSIAKNNTKTRMIRITWTLLDRSDVSKKTNGWLRINPAGIVILSSQEIDR